MTLIKTLFAAALAVTFATASMAASDENTLILQTKNGNVVIELMPDKAPSHVKQVSELANEGFYDGVKFHRVIEGFMAQTGDPTGTGRGGSDRSDLKAEFSDVKYERGIVGMARSQSPDSANSQFFIMFAEAPGLNGQYTVFGKVSEGMDVVDQIKKGARNDNGSVKDPDVIVKMRTKDKFN